MTRVEKTYKKQTTSEEQLKERLEFEMLLAEISASFVNVPAQQVDQRDHGCRAPDLRVSRPRSCGALAVVGETPGILTPTHVYGPGRSATPGQMREEHFPWYAQEMLAGRMVVVSSLEELPAEAAVDREICRQLGIKSNLTIPLSVGGEPPIGILGLNTMRAERDWPEALVKRLQLVAQIFANALARKRARQALRESEEINRATFDQAAVGIAHVGIDGSWLQVATDSVLSLVI